VSKAAMLGIYTVLLMGMDVTIICYCWECWKINFLCQEYIHWCLYSWMQMSQQWPTETDNVPMYNALLYMSYLTCQIIQITTLLRPM